MIVFINYNTHLQSTPAGTGRPQSENRCIISFPSSFQHFSIQCDCHEPSLWKPMSLKTALFAGKIKSNSY